MVRPYDHPSFVPFQAIFQHVFNCMMEDVAEQIIASQHYGIEFEKRGANRLMSLRFWKGAKLCRIFVCRSGLSGVGLTEEMGSLSRLLSAISTAPDVVAISGCAVDLIRTASLLPTWDPKLLPVWVARLEDLDAQGKLQRLRAHRHVLCPSMSSGLAWRLLMWGLGHRFDWTCPSKSILQICSA